MVVSIKRNFEDLGRVLLLFLALAFFLHHAEAWESPWMVFASAVVLLAGRFLNDLRVAYGLFFLLTLPAFWIGFPKQANHISLFLFLNTWLVIQWLRARGRPNWGYASQTLLFGLVVVYAWAAVHKMNVDFFDSSVSCANDMFQRLSDQYFRGHYNAFHNSLFAPVAVLVEVLAAVLLVFRRTFVFGVVSALLLHGLLAAVGFVDFASLALAVLIAALFSNGVFSTESRRRLNISVDYYLGAQMLSGFSMALLFRGFNEDRLYLLQVVAYELFTLHILIELARSHGWVSAEKKWRDRWSPVLVGSLVIFGGFNYLGLSTTGTFSMFSNLRTEGDEWNHYFIPRFVRVFPYQDKVYWVHSINEDYHLEDREHPAVGYGMPELEVYRLYSLWEKWDDFPGVFTIYKTDDWLTGETESVYGRLPPKPARFAWWEMKLLSFRKIQRYGSNQCRW